MQILQLQQLREGTDGGSEGVKRKSSVQTWETDPDPLQIPYRCFWCRLLLVESLGEFLVLTLVVETQPFKKDLENTSHHQCPRTHVEPEKKQRGVHTSPILWLTHVFIVWIGSSNTKLLSDQWPFDWPVILINEEFSDSKIPRHFTYKHTQIYTLLLAECCWWSGRFHQQPDGPPAPTASS